MLWVPCALFALMVKEGMPNYVYNKIELNVTEEQAKEIEEQVASTGKFDFNSLIQLPLHFLRMTALEAEVSQSKPSEELSPADNKILFELAREDNEDFLSSRSWKLENWGTKCNCYSSEISYADGILSISFTTAWSVPYPIIIAFGNKFQIPFQLKYFEDQERFWGIEKYESAEHVEGIYRSSKVLQKQEDYETLFKELMGEDFWEEMKKEEEEEDRRLEQENAR